jgi:hypothetical protein
MISDLGTPKPYFIMLHDQRIYVSHVKQKDFGVEEY